jgi:hypothetical protein
VCCCVLLVTTFPCPQPVCLSAFDCEFIIYQGRLKSSWTRLITPGWNFVDVRWQPLFRSTSLGKRCTSYNAPPTSLKRAADRWWLWNFLPPISIFMDGKGQKSHGMRSEPDSVFGLEKVDRWNPIRTSAIQSDGVKTKMYPKVAK